MLVDLRGGYGEKGGRLLVGENMPLCKVRIITIPDMNILHREMAIMV